MTPIERRVQRLPRHAPTPLTKATDTPIPCTTRSTSPKPATTSISDTKPPHCHATSRHATYHVSHILRPDLQHLPPAGVHDRVLRDSGGVARGLWLQAGDLGEAGSGGVQHAVPPVALLHLTAVQCWTDVERRRYGSGASEPSVSIFVQACSMPLFKSRLCLVFSQQHVRNGIDKLDGRPEQMRHR